jgi:DNA-binding SARP family transcriptional activator
MEFLLLGPLEVRDGDRIHRPGGKQGALLALLALEVRRTVSRGRLIDQLWRDDPPESAGKSVDVYVWRLRKAIPGLPIEKVGGGYRLDADLGAIDLRRFEALVERGRAALADGDPALASELLSDALALWRGPALAGLNGLVGTYIDELRLAAHEERIAADLETGSDAGLVAELEALVAAHPLRERLALLLMLALYRSGRQAEALAAYQGARAVLVKELGIEPSPALQRLEQGILRQDPDLERPRPTTAEPFGAVYPAATRNMPAELTTFVGRERELERLAALLYDPHIRLITLTGAGGSGKTRVGPRNSCAGFCGPAG